MSIFSRRCEQFCLEQLEVERVASNWPLTYERRKLLQDEISLSSHSFAHDLVEIIGLKSSDWMESGKRLRKNRAHFNFLMQSEFISHALKKPYGYAGDKDLMLMIYENKDRGTSQYSMLCNNVYQSLPAAAAVRARAKGVERVLNSLPPGSRVMSLACGPAYEVKNVIHAGGRQLLFDLLDHDPMSLAYTARTLGMQGITHVECNAYDLIKGGVSFRRIADGCAQGISYVPFNISYGKYDLIYSAGLYDYIKFFPMNKSRGVTGLTEVLFKFLKPGGRLIIGNFIQQGGKNPHTISHRFMMEAYSEWFLLYRSPDEISGFASTIKPSAATFEILDADLVHPISDTSTIGFLVLTRNF